MSAIDISFRIGGEAGQGVESSGAGFATALTRGGLHVAAVPDYYSRIRGGHNFFTIRASDEPIHAVRDAIQVLIALDAETVRRHVAHLVPGGLIILDEELKVDPQLTAGRDVRILALPLGKIAEAQGGRVMVNTGALAAAATAVGFGTELMLSVIADHFGHKGEAIIQANRQVALAAAQALTERYGDDFGWHMPPRALPPRLTIDANRAFALGALMGGCRFAAGYPMTPASSVLEYLAAQADGWGVVVKHAEDEIAAVNMCVGAAHAGVRALTATSGGGFDLMVEGVSLAAMLETPLVIYLAQRPGPSTGMATRTSQGDLLMALFCAHGEFPRIVLAPHTPEEAFQCGYRALNLAEKYQCLVLVVSDHYNSTALLSREAELFDPARVIIERGKLLTAAELAAMPDYKRYALTADGVSPRAVPGMGPQSVYLSTSDEHLENGHITEDPLVATRMLDKRMKKLEGAAAEMRPPFRYGPERAELTLVGWGSTFGPLREALELLNGQGRVANLVHFVDLWPFPVEAARAALADARRIVVVENNGTGQFATVLRAWGGIAAHQHLLKYDGRGFTADYILAHLES